MGWLNHSSVIPMFDLFLENRTLNQAEWCRTVIPAIGIDGGRRTVSLRP